jgi:hypothetical protein
MQPSEIRSYRYTFIAVTIQQFTEVPHAGKIRPHFHLGFQYKMYHTAPPTFCRVRYFGLGYAFKQEGQWSPTYSIEIPYFLGMPGS